MLADRLIIPLFGLLQRGWKRIREVGMSARFEQRERCRERELVLGEIDQQSAFCGGIAHGLLHRSLYLRLRPPAAREQFMREQKFLSWYEFFFSLGTPQTMRTAMQLVDKLPLNTILKHLPLGSLVTLLVQYGRSPKDILH